MEEMHRFTAAKAQVATALSRLADFFTRRGQAALLGRTYALADKLATEQFNLVVLGQFKRGKSTLINALLGADLLPMLLPAPLAKWHIRRQFLAACHEELDRNAGRLRADFQERLAKSARAFSTAFDTKVQDTLNRLTQILQRAEEDRRHSNTTLATRLEQLETDRLALTEILTGLAEDATPPDSVPG
jgi:septin family protein